MTVRAYACPHKTELSNNTRIISCILFFVFLLANEWNCDILRMHMALRLFITIVSVCNMLLGSICLLQMVHANNLASDHVLM